MVLAVILAVGAGAQVPTVRRAYVPPPPPTITISTEVPDILAAQTRLSSFIKALQAGQRSRAASMLSSRVSAAERQGLIEKKWLRYDPTNRGSVRQILYWRDLQIHTQRVMRDAVDLAVVSRTIALKATRRGKPSGILEVRMRKEQGSWWVDLHPVRTVRKRS
jgi:hypothetical protein